MRLRCPRCRALLEVGGQSPHVKFRCGGCSLPTDMGACIAATELVKLPIRFRLAFLFIPPVFMGGFFTFVIALPATGFELWWESLKASALGGLLVAVVSIVVGSLVFNRDIPKIASKLALAGITMGLGLWLRWQAGPGAVSTTAQSVLDVVALVWMILAIVQMFGVFKAPPPNAVAHVVEVDNLTA